MDADGRKKLLEKEVGSWLPNGTEVVLTNTPEWDKTEGMLVAKFNVSGPLAVSNGKNWTLPVHVFQTNEKPRFSSEQRTSPVFFDYASRRVDEVHIVLPSGMEVESLPPEAQAKTRILFTPPNRNAREPMELWPSATRQ